MVNLAQASDAVSCFLLQPYRLAGESSCRSILRASMPTPKSRPIPAIDNEDGTEMSAATYHASECLATYTFSHPLCFPELVVAEVNSKIS